MDRERLEALERRVAHLEAAILELARPADWAFTSHTDDLGAPETLRAVVRRAMQDALRRNGGSQKRAAKELGISPRMMVYRVQSLGLMARTRKRA